MLIILKGNGMPLKPTDAHQEWTQSLYGTLYSYIFLYILHKEMTCFIVLNFMWFNWFKYSYYFCGFSSGPSSSQIDTWRQEETRILSDQGDSSFNLIPISLKAKYCNIMQNYTAHRGSGSEIGITHQPTVTPTVSHRCPRDWETFDR